jgi:hypothetical protein
VRLNRIAGPGFAAIGCEGLHNVLILPDGFVDDPQGSDRAAFEHYARQLVTLLTTNSQTRPFDVLADKFNYFTTWVPSPQAGISTMSEQRTVAVDDNVRGRDVELPEMTFLAENTAGAAISTSFAGLLVGNATPGAAQ